MGLIAKLFPKRSSTGAAATTNSNSQYRGVQINVDRSNCCAAVRLIDGKRFLSDEVPALPVDHCDVARCQCTYGLFNDRRSDARRTSDVIFDVASQLHPQDQRDAQSAGRRDND